MSDLFSIADHAAAGRRRKAELSAKSPRELISAARLDLGPDQEAAVADRLSQMPVTCRNTYLRAMRGKSMAAAIKAHCLECCGWQRREVEMCTALACPLYPYRPFKD